VELRQQDSGGRRSAVVGEKVTVALGENPTTGYRWHADIDELSLRATADHFDGQADTPGASGVRYVTYTTLRPGPARLRLVKQRVWETQPVDEFVIDLEVREG
jgi:predicted secreted protein